MNKEKAFIFVASILVIVTAIVVVEAIRLTFFTAETPGWCPIYMERLKGFSLGIIVSLFVVSIGLYFKSLSKICERAVRRQEFKD